MTLAALVRQGCAAVRKPDWFRDSRLCLTLYRDADGQWCRGVWADLYSPEQAVLGLPTPQHVLLIQDEDDDWEPCEERHGDAAA